jgi:hypothetical protein
MGLEVPEENSKETNLHHWRGCLSSYIALLRGKTKRNGWKYKDKSIRSIQTNVRVVAATNRNLQEAIAAGTFRSDLFEVFGPSGAAATLGMPRSTLESKIRSLKISKNRFKTCAGMLSADLG